MNTTHPVTTTGDGVRPTLSRRTAVTMHHKNTWRKVGYTTLAIVTLPFTIVPALVIGAMVLSAALSDMKLLASMVPAPKAVTA